MSESPTANGPLIRRLRTDGGLSLAGLSGQAEISASYLSRVERDLRAPSVHFVDHVARVLGVPTAMLLLPD